MFEQKWHSRRSASGFGMVCAGVAITIALMAGCARGAKPAGANATKPEEATKSPTAKATTDAPGAPDAKSAVDPVGEPTDPMLRMGYRMEWRGYPQADARSGIKFLDVLGDAVSVQDARNMITIMDPATGANRWSLNLGSSLAKFVGNLRIDDRIVCCSDNEVQIFDIRTGQLKVRQRLSVLANTKPVLFGNLAVFGGSTGEVFGHNLVTGFKLWGYRLGGSVKATPVAVGQSVAAVSQAGDVILLDPRTGESQGRRRSIFAGLENNPVASDSAVYIAGTDQSLWAISADDGKQIWRVRTPDPLTEQPTLHDGRLYQFLPSSGFVAFDAGTGEKAWTAKDVAGTLVGVRNKRLLVWDARSMTAYELDAKRGDIVEKSEWPGVTKVTLDGFVDGNLYLAKRDGTVEKYSVR